MSKRPLPVTIVACLYILAGSIGLIYHATELKFAALFQNEAVLVCLIRALAIVGGVCMLRGQNWARWLAILWMAYHVLLSVFHPIGQLVGHGVFLIVIGYFLFRPDASAYFHSARPTH